MSSSVGRPTAVPWALSHVMGQVAISLSSVGVVGLLDCVAGAAVAASNAVHDHKYDRFFHWYSLLSRIFSNFTIFYYNFPADTT